MSGPIWFVIIMLIVCLALIPASILFAKHVDKKVEKKKIAQLSIINKYFSPYATIMSIERSGEFNQHRECIVRNSTGSFRKRVNCYGNYVVGDMVTLDVDDNGDIYVRERVI